MNEDARIAEVTRLLEARLRDIENEYNSLSFYLSMDEEVSND